MKLSTGYLKDYLVTKYGCDPKTTKRTSKSKNDSGQIVRKFSSNKGLAVVVSNQEDEVVVSCDLIDQVENNGYYFCYAPKLTKRTREENEIDDVSTFLITPIAYYDANDFLSDEWNPELPKLLEDRFAEDMESIFETQMSQTEAEAFLLSKGFVENKKMAKWDLID